MMFWLLAATILFIILMASEDAYFNLVRFVHRKHVSRWVLQYVRTDQTPCHVVPDNLEPYW